MPARMCSAGPEPISIVGYNAATYHSEASSWYVGCSVVSLFRGSAIRGWTGR